MFGNHTKRPDGRQHPRLGAVDVVDAITVSRVLALTADGQLEVTRERVAGLAAWPVRHTRTTPAAAAHVPPTVTVVVPNFVARVIAIEHAATSQCCEYGPLGSLLQFTVGWLPELLGCKGWSLGSDRRVSRGYCSGQVQQNTSARAR